MTKNTGFQQAIYAEKFTEKGDVPLDKDGNFCFISGNKQAILLLEGHDNPNPTKYEVVGSFKEGEVLDTYPSMVYNTDACPLLEPEAKLPEYKKEEEKTMYLYTNAQYQIYGCDWDAKVLDFGTGNPNKGTYTYTKIGEYEWMTQNVRMNPVLGRIWDKWILQQSMIDTYINMSGYDTMTVEQSQQLEGGFWGGSMGGHEVDAFFHNTKFFKDSLMTKEIVGWKQPTTNDFAQLFAMSDTLDYNGIIAFHGIEKGNSKYPFRTDWENRAQNKSGFSMIPTGTRNNITGAYANPRRACAFKTDIDDGTIIRFEVATSMPASIIADSNDNINSVYPNSSIKFHLVSVRYCRILTDQELGYKLWRDDANDKILVTKLVDPQPANTIELEKGLLRGMAVRWMNEDKTKVLAPLSKLLGEIEKTKNGGEYGWYGFYE